MPQSPAAAAPLEAAVALGANLGSPLECIREAEARLSADPGLEFRARSSIWLTEPVGGPPGQDWYHNRVLLYLTRMAPQALMELLLGVERDLGRVRAERWGPRVIDLDLLFLGDTTLGLELVTLPHPRLQDRAFVLRPLSEVAPSWVHPTLGLTPQEMLLRLPGDGPKTVRLEGA